MKTLFEQIRDDAHLVDDKCHLFHDWLCADFWLLGKSKVLMKKVKEIANSHRFDKEKTYVFFRNIQPMVGNTYDDFRICDTETEDVLFTVIPRSPYATGNGKAEVWGKENNFACSLVKGSWKDVVAFFNKTED